MMVKYILTCLILIFQPLYAKIEAPNYTFDHQIFDDFMPSKNLNNLNIKWGNPKILSKDNGIDFLRFEIKKTNYQFNIFVQARSGKILDFYARLPSYFLHDVFHEELIKKWGKQSTFKRKNEEALYLWNKDQIQQVYFASCSITCFPIFYTSFSTEVKDFTPILKKLNPKIKFEQD